MAEAQPGTTEHGICALDARHATRHALPTVPHDDRDPHRLLVIGVDRAGHLLEIIVLEPETRPRIVPAMLLRGSFHRYLDRPPADHHAPAPPWKENLRTSAPPPSVPEEHAAAEDWLNCLDPGTSPAAVVPQDVRDVAAAVDRIHAAEEEVVTAVLRARRVGASWSNLALALGVSR